jgi:ribosomal-protein-alanine N-acetyltransferase
LFFHIIDKNTNENIGGCGFHNWFAEHSRAEIGYHIINENFKQKGIMTEAVQAVINCGFNTMNLNRIEAFTSPKNIASLRIIEKNNFKKEGFLKEHYFVNNNLEDSIVFALLKNDYFK